MLLGVVGIVSQVDVLHVRAAQILLQVFAVDGGAGGAEVARLAYRLFLVILVGEIRLGRIHGCGQLHLAGGNRRSGRGSDSFLLGFEYFAHGSRGGIAVKEGIRGVISVQRLEDAQDIVGGDRRAGPRVNAQVLPAFTLAVVGDVGNRAEAHQLAVGLPDIIRDHLGLHLFIGGVRRGGRRVAVAPEAAQIVSRGVCVKAQRADRRVFDLARGGQRQFHISGRPDVHVGAAAGAGDKGHLILDVAARHILERYERVKQVLLLRAVDVAEGNDSHLIGLASFTQLGCAVQEGVHVADGQFVRRCGHTEHEQAQENSQDDFAHCITSFFNLVSSSYRIQCRPSTCRRDI